MRTLREVCHCGHAKNTHFEGKEACLGSRCDCPGYRDDMQPDPLKAAPRNPNHGVKFQRDGSWTPCQCYDCKRYREWKSQRGAW